MCSYNGTVQIQFFEIRVLGELGEYFFPYATDRPPAETPVNAVPLTEARRQVTPRRSGSHNPQHGFKKQAIIFGSSTRVCRLARQQMSNTDPLVVA